MFESDSGVGLKCFETKVRHIQSHNRGLSKEKKKKKRKEIALASHQELISAPLVNISIRTFFHSKTEKSPNDTYCHPLLSWGSVHFAQAYPEPHYTALCQPSKNSKPTQNNGHITADLKERVRKKKKKKEPERKEESMRRSRRRWKILAGKINTSDLEIFSYFPSLMFSKYCYSVPGGTFCTRYVPINAAHIWDSNSI